MSPHRKHPLNFDAAINGGNAARAFLARIAESAKGWTLSGVDESALAGEHLFTYCCDFGTNQSWMACVNYLDFNNRIEEIRDLPHLWPEVVDVLDHDIDLLITSLRDPFRSDSTARASDVEMGLQKMHESVCNFAGTTGIAFDVELNQPGSHFLILRCGDQSTGSIFRPLMVPAYLAQGSGSLSVAQFTAIIESMVERDAKEHPEWFGL